MLSNQKYRISNIAKDFELKNKEVIELLEKNGKDLAPYASLRGL